MALTVRKMEETDTLAVQALFARVGSTVSLTEMDHFVVVENDEGALVGTVGLDKKGELGLLRSMVIDSERTHPAAPIEFIQLAIAFAQTKGIKMIYALSAGKAALFETLGFSERMRADLPAEIKQMDHYQSVVETGDPTVWAYLCSHS